MLSYLRHGGNQTVLVVLNMSGSVQQVNFDLTQQGFAPAKVKPLLTTLRNPPKGRLGKVSLEPFSVYVARLSKQ